MTSLHYSPSRSLQAKIGRRLTQWRLAAPAMVTPTRPIVSFTFDDFPKSALAGADIVEDQGGQATFYLATAMLGQRQTPMGDMADARDVLDLSARGHEIGAHTHSHPDCAQLGLEDFRREVAENLIHMDALGLEQPPASFAFPYGETTHTINREVSNLFSVGRGVLPGLNKGAVDRSQLHAVELDRSSNSEKRAQAALETCLKTNAWLIFFTHDVDAAASSYGTTPETLKALAKAAVDGGAVLSTVHEGAVLSGLIPPPAGSGQPTGEPLENPAQLAG